MSGFGRFTGPDGVIVMGYFESGELRDEGWHWIITPDGVAVRPADGDSLLWGNEDMVALARAALALNEAFFEPGEKNDHWFTVDPFEGVWQMHREFRDGTKVLEWPIGAVGMLFHSDHWLQLRCRDRSPCMLESEPDGDEEDYSKISLPGPEDRDWESVERHVGRAMDAGLRFRAQAERNPGGQGAGS